MTIFAGKNPITILEEIQYHMKIMSCCLMPTTLTFPKLGKLFPGMCAAKEFGKSLLDAVRLTKVFFDAKCEALSENTIILIWYRL